MGKRLTVLIGVLICCLGLSARTYEGGKKYESYKGLVMAGYQGWFNAPEDGARRGWYHYTGPDGFKPGSCTIDLWPEVSEYEKLHKTEFVFEDGTPAYTFSSYDASTVETHFRWMEEYGIDGVFMQRFVAEIKGKSGKRHFNKVLDSAMESANRHSRAICIMYDLSGMHPGDENILIADIKELASRHSLFDHDSNPSYLYHNGKPLVTVWGVGFNDNRKYGYKEADAIITALEDMGFAIMLGVPTQWRTLDGDTIDDPVLHDLIRRCDVVMPWFVGRYNENTYTRYQPRIDADIKWVAANDVDYAPLCFPGFSWENMIRRGRGVQIDRNSGSFFWKQLHNVIASGAEMIYIAMFDEIDEGTAIFKCAHRVPVPAENSEFVPMDEDVPSDHYLFLAGEAGKMLRKEKPLQKTMPRKECATSPVCCAKEPVDYVNPYIGNISHLLVPTFPTVQLPNSMLRVYPERSDYTSERVNGLPVIVTNHRERSAFNLTPYQGDEPRPVKAYTYDNEKLTPYSFKVDIDDHNMGVHYALSHQSAIYQIDFRQEGKPVWLSVNSRGGEIRKNGRGVSGYQKLSGNTNVYLYLETEADPIQTKEIKADHNSCIALRFADGTTSVRLRYGVSFISEEQAQKNLRRELDSYDVEALAQAGRKVWNAALERIKVEGGSEDDKTVFYTSYYRTFERPICMSEDGRYFSAFDGKVHEDGGRPFYTDDWIWDTYRAAHPLRLLMDRGVEENILSSYLRMAEQMGNMWMPTFPEVTGDSRRMNSNHAVVTFADAVAKGLRVNVKKAYEAARKGMEEKTLAPWSGAPAGWLDKFYKENGYVPALKYGEEETDPNVHSFEKRQPVAVTLGTSYDQWALSILADRLGLEKETAYYQKCAHNYRNLYNPQTGFFHPKDKDGNWIEPFDYRWPGGMGAREFYGENNGWVYRWDVPHNVADLISLMGGKEKFVENLDRTFTEPLGKSKFEFFAQLPDHTGNVGQFSMANEPSLHVPYLYNYAGQPWKTQKRIRQMLKTWFRNDLMGVPGDEDGGGMTAFVVFSSLGFYPVTPGLPSYNIGSPLFENAKIVMSNGKVFEIVAENVSDENKYIQSATLNGEEWNKPWFSHDDIKEGARLVLVMGSTPNKAWGSSDDAVPPSIDNL